MAIWYLGSTKYTAIAQWTANTAYVVGDIVRQLAAPTLHNERAFRCTTAGTSHLTTEPTWTLTKGATTNDNTVVWTEVTGNSAYGWNAAAPRQRLFMNGASSWSAAGDTVYRHENHAESQTTQIALTSPGTAAAPLKIYTVNDAVTALSTGASMTVNGGSNNFDFAGFTYDYGMTYIGAAAGGNQVNFNSTGPNYYRLEEGAFTFTGNSSITVGANASSLDDRAVEFKNVDITFNSTGGGITLDGLLKWHGGSVLGSTLPTNLIPNVSTGPGGYLQAYGLDLSVLGSGKTLVAINWGQAGEILFENCKLGASVAYTSGSHSGQGGPKVRIVNCDSGATNYNYHGQDYGGTITDESVIKYLADVSRKMVTTANVTFFAPLVLDDIIVYNVDTGVSKTLTVEVVNDGVTYNDNELWVEVEALTDASFPISSFTDDFIADPVFGTPAAQASSTAAWITTGLGSPVKQKLEATFTPEMAGPLKVRVMFAKASSTVYVDPKVSLT